jgi:hypothetical protein
MPNTTLWARVSIYLANHSSISQTINQFWSGFRGFPYFFLRYSTVRLLWGRYDLRSRYVQSNILRFTHGNEIQSQRQSQRLTSFHEGQGRKKNTSAAETPFQTKTVLPNRLWTLWILGIFSVFTFDITWLTRSHWLVDHWQKMTKVLAASSCSELKRVKFSSALWLQSSTTLTTRI